jgi:hypothetical protein
MKRWILIPVGLVSAATAVLVMLTMVGGFAFTYDPIQSDGSIDNAPVRAFGFFLLGVPTTLLIAFVGYITVLGLHPPVRVFSRAHLLWSFAIATCACILLAVSARGSFAYWYEVLYLALAVPLLFVPLELGFLAGSGVGAWHSSRSRRTPPGTPTRPATQAHDVMPHDN